MEERDVKLSREVLTPERHSRSAGLVIIVATAMFFTLASSTMVLRASFVSQDRLSPHVITVIPANPMATTVPLTVQSLDADPGDGDENEKAKRGDEDETDKSSSAKVVCTRGVFYTSTRKALPMQFCAPLSEGPVIRPAR